MAVFSLRFAFVSSVRHSLLQAQPPQNAGALVSNLNAKMVLFRESCTFSASPHTHQRHPTHTTDATTLVMITTDATENVCEKSCTPNKNFAENDTIDRRVIDKNATENH
jgi:hypothetical protein